MCLFSIILLLVCALANDTACQKDFENCAFQIARHLLINHGIFQQNNDLCLYSQEKKIGQFVWKIRCGKIGVEISTTITYGFWVHSKIALICIHLWQKQIQIWKKSWKKKWFYFPALRSERFRDVFEWTENRNKALSINEQRFGNVFSKTKSNVKRNAFHYSWEFHKIMIAIDWSHF